MGWESGQPSHRLVVTIGAFRAEAEYQQRLGTKGILGSGTGQRSQTIPGGGTMRYAGTAGASFQALLGLSFPLVNQPWGPSRPKHWR